MGGISLVATTTMINNPAARGLLSKSPIPISAQYAMSYVGFLLIIISGIAMLKGRNWARFLYVICSLIGFIIDIVASPMKVAMIPGVVVFLVAAFFLFRRRANAFFDPLEETMGAQDI
jgi:hypothetical protein